MLDFTLDNAIRQTRILGRACFIGNFRNSAAVFEQAGRLFRLLCATKNPKAYVDQNKSQLFTAVRDSLRLLRQLITEQRRRSDDNYGRLVSR